MTASASNFDGLVILLIGIGLSGGGAWALMEIVQGTLGLDLIRAFGAALLISGVLFAGIAWLVRRLWS